MRKGESEETRRNIGGRTNRERKGEGEAREIH